MDQYKHLERSLDRELSKYPFMLQLEHRTGIKKTNIVLAILLGLLTLLLLSILPDMVLLILTYLYPALMTVSAIEAHDKQRDTHWLAYWLILGGWTATEMMLGGWLARVIPFYTLVKLIGCIWLYWPGSAGAVMVYERGVRPIALTILSHPTVKQLHKEATARMSNISTGSSGLTAKTGLGEKKSGTAPSKEMPKNPDGKKIVEEIQKNNASPLSVNGNEAPIDDKKND